MSNQNKSPPIPRDQLCCSIRRAKLLFLTIPTSKLRGVRWITLNFPLVTPYRYIIHGFIKTFLQPRHSPLWGNEFYLFSYQLCKLYFTLFIFKRPPETSLCRLDIVLFCAFAYRELISTMEVIWKILQHVVHIILSSGTVFNTGIIPNGLPYLQSLMCPSSYIDVTV